MTESNIKNKSGGGMQTRKKGSKKIPPICEYQVTGQQGSTMVLKCKRCPGPHKIEQKCLGPLLAAFSKEYDIDTVKMSHFIEKEYHGISIELLRKISQLADEIEDLSLREPTEEYSAYKGKNDPKKTVCQRCTLYPRKFFTKLRVLLIKDISKFYALNKKIVGKLPLFKKKTSFCHRCIHDTTEDLNYIFDKYEKIVGFVLSNSPMTGKLDSSPWAGQNMGALNSYLSPLLNYQKNIRSYGGQFPRICQVCMYPLKGHERNCPNCSTKITGN